MSLHVNPGQCRSLSSGEEKVGVRRLWACAAWAGIERCFSKGWPLSC